MAKTRRMWCTLVLREESWGRPIVDLERAIRKVAPDAVLWFPATDDATGKHDPDLPYSPYVFVQAPLPPRLARLTIVERALTEPINEAELTASVGKKVPVAIGDEVTVNLGNGGLYGTVTKTRGNECRVRVLLNSGARDMWVDKKLVQVH